MKKLLYITLFGLLSCGRQKPVSEISRLGPFVPGVTDTDAIHKLSEQLGRPIRLFDMGSSNDFNYADALTNGGHITEVLRRMPDSLSQTPERWRQFILPDYVLLNRYRCDLYLDFFDGLLVKVKCLAPDPNLIADLETKYGKRPFGWADEEKGDCDCEKDGKVIPFKCELKTEYWDGDSVKLGIYALTSRDFRCDIVQDTYVKIEHNRRYGQLMTFLKTADQHLKSTNDAKKVKELEAL